ncbi:ATP-binding protein [Corynebacterium cystitidis]|uniref:ATP-binding protein n=1 Tax=Corynebacterium cystitidis TaxID=35757 RepID=UPI00211E2BF1|nr:ATP-binding protein [Corynebacterium cystitidis]
MNRSRTWLGVTSRSRCCRYHNRTPPTPDQLFQEWIRIGGFPATVQLTDPVVIRQANTSLFDSIFTRDISLRGQIRDTEMFLRVARFIFDNAGSPVATHRIANHLKQEGFTASSETINRYLALMSDARLIYQCRDYDTKSKRWLSTNGKFYFVDPGLRTALLGSRTFNLGDDLENMVYLELRRRGFHVSTGTVPRGEIDFIATKDSLQLHIQVALTASDEGTLRRELAPFKTLDAGSRCLLLTTDRFSPDTGAVDWCDAIAFLNGAPLPGEDSHR